MEDYRTMGGNVPFRWQSKDGSSKSYEDMDKVHIQNCIKKIKRTCEEAKMKLEILKDNDIAALPFDDLKSFVDGMTIMNLEAEAVCEFGNQHYIPLKQILKEKEEEEIRTSEEKEKSLSVEDNTSSEWF